MKIRTLWLIIIICSAFDVIYSYILWTDNYEVNVDAYVFELNPIARFVESNGSLVLPDLISIKVLSLLAVYWITKLLSENLKLLLLKFLAGLYIALVTYELTLPYLLQLFSHF
ncbi:hypothetical protein [Acidianus brierleyi]|uniref:DUF5658 domain-containing protein n=1 Tax=Acidianus brierleyi TaxID=41673 RepID=A0A2U9IF17_9CREN|nr:hypothetical protein [Acidianus brierleyi]AWR94585.1 hypothetical protein DFR85_08250 [Acidianus brierleyi]